MKSQYEQNFINRDFTVKYNIQEFENCHFKNCNFNNVIFENSKFIDCSFETCDFSSANIHQTIFRNIQFMHCKMIGIRFDECNPFGLGASFQSCNLDYSMFSGMDLRKVNFDACTMIEVDLSESNLQKSNLTNCRLLNAVFDNTDLRETDLRGSIGFRINPLQNKIKKMKISRTEIEGILQQYDLCIE